MEIETSGLAAIFPERQSKAVNAVDGLQPNLHRNETFHLFYLRRQQ